MGTDNVHSKEELPKSFLHGLIKLPKHLTHQEVPESLQKEGNIQNLREMVETGI